MLINSDEIQRLALLDSVCYEKEGFLFVRERNDRILSWRNEAFIERLCRLKGNLLFILDTNTANAANDVYLPSLPVSSSSSADRSIVYALVLEEYTIRLVDESSDKHFCFVIDFGKNETAKPFFFASISQHERDSWVEAIHLSSFVYLRLIYKSFLKLKPNIEQLPQTSPANESTVSENSVVFTISCSVIFYGYGHECFEPNLFVTVYKRDDKLDAWQFLGKTETITSRSVSFAKQFHFTPKNDNIYSLKFKVFDVIERLTETRIFLGEAIHVHTTEADEVIRKANVVIYELQLVSSLRDSQVIGKLQLHVRNKKPTNEVPGNRGTISRPQSLFVKKSLSSSSEQNTTSSENKYQDSNGCTESSVVKDSLSGFKFRNCSVPNSLHPDNSPITPLTTTTIMSSPLIILTLDGNLFVNTVHRSFQFEIPVKVKTISVSELMAESTYCLVFPQTLMNIFMDDEKKLMNCVTYSLGEVKSEWQRPQMRVLESHLRLVNVVTESINELYQIQLQKRYFRPSTAKLEPHFQFVPINFHLQRCLVTEVDNVTVNGINDASKYNVLDLYTVGAFASHMMGFENGGIQLKSEIKNNTCVAKVWKAMKKFFRISSICLQIESNLKKLVTYLEDELADEHLITSTYGIIDCKAKSLLTILDPKEVDECVLSLESFRNTSLNSSSNSMRRTDSDPLQNDSNEMNHCKIKRHSSLPIEEHLEIEPVDLLHLNIKASLISMSGKINKRSSQMKEDFEPSRKKLSAAIEALQRMASICYAIESIKLQREHLELFYSYRLRRNMVFTQALTAVIIAVLGEVNSPNFQRQIVDTNSVFIYFEGLLSCHAEEIGMLQDMAFAIEELNDCVTFVFTNVGNETLQPHIPRIEGNGFNLRVIIPVTSSTIIAGSLECQVTGLLFNIGINEHATLAETFGQVKIQDEINKSSFLQLETFISNFIDLEDRELINDVTALKTELWSNRAKNVRVLHLMEQITYKLNGLRFTSCKSAKDRTAMAVTLEEVRKCAHLYDFSEIRDVHLFQQMLDTLRSEGTRRENTRKNVGVAKYAFNTLRVMTLPKLYRPPPGTYGNVQT
ncbi:hypothetical protein B4U79_02585 [Dinothrombium tinctorium]|uniref:PH domain-containing protein n=1 Tax=Dinothrombium tinctorium TaxID=1965070 RepID=A0A3S3PRA8_9ACAR|nr:hypothetical protein B4U79_05850 [Dinothrombium tinctorium]RWS06705.1 hypothetical protein B4U79_02585 [Dinothrombium tinctorium]